MDKLYAALGFRRARAIPPEGWPDQYGGSQVILDLTVADRLRALLSGKIMVDIIHKMDEPPRVWESERAFSVLPPNYE